MEDFIYYSKLFSIYEFLLTEKQKEIFNLYYNENLSLNEIAESLNVSKSYVGNIIKKVKTKLDYLEDNLHVLELKEKGN